MLIAYLLFISGVFSQSNIFPRPYAIGDVEADDLFKPPLDPTNTLSPFRGPLDPPLQKPQSYRTIYLQWWRHPSLVDATEPAGPGRPILKVLLTNEAGLNAVANEKYTFKLEQPNLGTDPWGCAADRGGDLGNCRCNDLDPTEYDGIANPTYDGTVAGRVISVELPNWNYFEHAPYPHQNPYIRTYRKLCMREPQRTNAGVIQSYQPFIDTTVWVAVTRPCSATVTAPFTCATNNLEQWLSRAPNGGRFPTNTYDVNWICNNVGYLGAFFNMNTVAPNANAVAVSTRVDQEYCWGETIEMIRARRLRTQCCGAREATAGREVDANSRFFGTCFNPNVESCCGWKPFKTAEEHCCSRYSARINYMDQPCKCQKGGTWPTNTEEVFDCQRYGATVAIDQDFRDNGPTQTTRQCCVNSKYTGAGNMWDEPLAMRQYGFCYDTTDEKVRCCDDGNIYDPGAEQCCPINGIQSLNKPCPCDRSSDCPSHNNMCCLQRFAPSWPESESLSQVQRGGFNADIQSQCNKYANYPEGSAPAENQRCYGSCYSSAYQICCNGQLCSREYDRCCNSTCCNRFTSTCMEGTRPGSWGFGGRHNPNDYKVSFEVCSEKECTTTKRAFWVFVMPVFWLFASLAGLSLVIIVAKRATEHVFEMTEKAFVFFAVLLVFIAMPHYFSPSYKYGIVAVLCGLICILAAVLRSVKLSFVAIVVVLITVLYWVDLFKGNIYLSFATKIPNGNSQTPLVSTIIEYILVLERMPSECTSFYDFFEHDKYVHDFERVYNPTKMTYAYCSKAWLTALLIFSILGVLFLLMLVLLSCFSFAKKLIPKAPKDDLVFEVRPEYE